MVRIGRYVAVSARTRHDKTNMLRYGSHQPYRSPHRYPYWPFRSLFQLYQSMYRLHWSYIDRISRHISHIGHIGPHIDHIKPVSSVWTRIGGRFLEGFFKITSFYIFFFIYKINDTPTAASNRDMSFCRLPIPRRQTWVKSCHAYSLKERNPGQRNYQIPVKQVWVADIPAKICFFIWQVITGTLFTNDKIEKFEPEVINSCCLREEQQENMEHLFLNCAYTENIWYNFLSVFGKHGPNENSITDWIIKWWSKIWDNKQEEWAWEERNNKCFRQEKMNWQDIYQDVLLSLWSWSQHPEGIISCSCNDWMSCCGQISWVYCNYVKFFVKCISKIICVLLFQKEKLKKPFLLKSSMGQSK